VNKLLRILLFVLLCEGVGLVSSVFTFNSLQAWYPALVKPFFNPPGWIFGPVWTTLYFLMGISLYLVWGKKKTDLKWFWIQLILNSLWSIAFFGLKNPIIAFILVIFLLISIFLTIKTFAKVNKTSAYLLYPYLGWVSFASILNLSIVILNR
jgi:tryptophan-rich sensory protein